MASITELTEDLRERQFALAAAQREADEFPEMAEDIAPYQLAVKNAQTALDAIKGRPLVGRPAPPIPPKTPRPKVADAAPAGSDIESIEAQIKDLDAKLMTAIRRKANATITSKLSNLIMTKKIELADLETQRDEASPAGQRSAECKQLENEIETLTAERETTIRTFDMKLEKLNERLRAIAPAEQPVGVVTKKRLEEFEDDLERLRGNMGDRRAEYKRLYGVEPGAGIDGHATGMVRVRPAPPTSD